MKHIRSGTLYVTSRVALLLALAPAGFAATPAPPHEESEEIEARERWFSETRVTADGKVPKNHRLDALRQRDAMLAPAGLTGDRWVFIGPAPLVDGPKEFSGRVTSIAPHPTNSDVAYVGTAQGGVWKTTNGGITWLPLTDHEASLAIGSLAVAPSSPSIIYAGTGEGNFSCIAYFGAGILKSTDGGSSWTLLANDVFAGASVASLAVHPTNPAVVLAGGSWGFAGYQCANGSGGLGVWRSTDGGMSWIQVIPGPVSDVVFVPDNPSRAFAGLWNDGVYRSTNGGIDWTKLAGGLPTKVGRIDLAVDPTNGQRVYAAVDGPSLGIYRSDDGGNSWAPLPVPSGSCHYWALSDPCTYAFSSTHTCYWNLYISVAPDGAVWLGGLGVWRSTTQGASWTNACPPDMHVDQHAIGFSGNRVWAGNDGGVFVSTDAGISWQPRNEGLGTVQFYPGASVHPEGTPRALAGTQDNGTLRYDGGTTWTQIGYGDGGFTAISEQDPDQTWYISHQFLNIYKTTDGGASFLPATSGLADTNTGWAAFIAPYAMCPASSSVLVAGTKAAWRTNDAAASWSLDSDDPLHVDRYPAYTVVFDSTDSTCGTYWLGLRYGDVFRTTNGGASWTNATTTLNEGPITELAVDPSNGNVVYLACGFLETPHLYKSTNALAVVPTWTPITNGLPNAPVNSILIDPDTPSTLYVGTDVGVFRSADGGLHWTPFNKGLPNVAVFDLAADGSSNTLMAFTYGRGAFRLSSGGPGEAAIVRAQRGPGQSVIVRYQSGCAALDHAIVWGLSPIGGALSWSGEACGVGSTGIAAFDPGTVPSGRFAYFAVVAQDDLSEGSYGRNRVGAERPEAAGLALCDRPQSLTGCVVP